MDKRFIFPREMTGRRTILPGLVIALAAVFACSELPTERIGPDDPLGHHRPGHAGGGSGGGGDEDGDDQEPQRYHVRVIDAGGTFPGNSIALGIDDDGLVVGYGRLEFSSERYAFLWRDGHTDLQRVTTVDSDAWSEAAAVDDGTIVGWEGDPFTPLAYASDGTTALRLDPLDVEPCLEDHRWSRATAIGGGLVAGTSRCLIEVEEADTTYYRSLEWPVVWLVSEGYARHELPMRDGDSNGIVRDATDGGVVLGGLWRDGRNMVVIWRVEGDQISGPEDLHSGSLQTARAINRDGDIIGPAGVHAQFVSASGAVVDLERLHQRDDSVLAAALSDRSLDGHVRVVGHSGDRPVLWTVDAENGVLLSASHLDIPDGHYKAARALAVNSSGVIAGSSITRSLRQENARERATVWFPAD